MKPNSNRPCAENRRKFFSRLLPTSSGLSGNSPDQKAKKLVPNLRLVQKSGCLACGACVRGCENDALTYEDSTSAEVPADRQNGLRTKYWVPEKCQRCGKCISRCPDSLLKFEAEVESLEPAREKVVLTQFKFRRCLGCGNIIIEPETTFCITCQRRGIAGLTY